MMKLDEVGTLPTEVPATSFPGMREALRAWWSASGRPFPWRIASDPYAIFLAEVALQKTQVAKALRAYADLIGAYPTVSALAQAPDEHLDRVFAWLGLRKRARFLRDAATCISAQHGGQIPRTRTALKGLAGVGDYTANAILCFGFGDSEPIVDTTIARVLTRALGFRLTKEAWQDPVAWRVAEAFLDATHPVEHNYALLDLAALICTPSSPRCDACPLSGWCIYAQVGRRGAQETPPVSADRTRSRARISKGIEMRRQHIDASPASSASAQRAGE